MLQKGGGKGKKAITSFHDEPGTPQEGRRGGKGELRRKELSTLTLREKPLLILEKRGEKQVMGGKYSRIGEKKESILLKGGGKKGKGREGAFFNGRRRGRPSSCGKKKKKKVSPFLTFLERQGVLKGYWRSLR